MSWFKKKKIFYPPILYKETQTIVETISKIYKCDFITYWGAYNSNMASNDVIVFKEILKRKTSDKLCLFIKSSGGSSKVALRLTHLLRNTYKNITVLAPIECASAATMLALGADVIKMGSTSFLTAIDTSVTHDLSPVDSDGDKVSVNQNELDRVIKLWNKEKSKNEKNPYKHLYNHVHPLVLGAVDRASSLSIKLTSEILGYHMKDEDVIHKISNHLNAEYPAHGYPITSNEAKKLGLKIENLEEDTNDLLSDLNQLYSEMAQKAYTDYDEYKFHDSQILTIIEIAGLKVYYQKDKDMVWRVEDKQWIPSNDNSAWIKSESTGNKILYIR